MPTLSFAQGVDYSGTIDTTIREASPRSAPGSALALFADGDLGAQVQALLAFTGLFGNGPGQIPIGATITSATLTLRVSDASTSSVSMSRMLVDWNELSSWNALGSGVQLGVEATDTVVISSSATGLRSYNVTDSVQAWLNGAGTADQANAANDGWVFTMSGTDQWAFRSSESAVVPVLTVEYSLDGGGTPLLAFAGPVSQAEGTSASATPFVFTVNRSGDGSGSASVDWVVTGTGGAPATAADFAGGALPSGTINFAPGQLSRTITVNVVADSTDEANETFNITLSNASGAQISGGTATGTIVDDDTGGGGTGEVIAVRIYQGSAWGTGTANNRFGSTDPTDIAYDPSTGRFFVSDSEVDESPFNASFNLFKLDGDADLVQGISLRGFTSEPTGVALWVDQTSGEKLLFISSDDQKRVYVVDADDPATVLRSFSTTTFGVQDPEDLSINPNNGNLFILSENDRSIYEVTQNGDFVSKVRLPSPFGDAEGLVYDAEHNQFYVSGGFSTKIYVVSRSGVLTDTIDVLAQYPNSNGARVFPKGLELAPASDGSGKLSLWVTDYGRDQVADGRLFELVLDRPAPMAAATTATALSLDSFETELRLGSASQPIFAFNDRGLPPMDSGHTEHDLSWHDADQGGDIWLI